LGLGDVWARELRLEDVWAWELGLHGEKSERFNPFFSQCIEDV